MKEIKIYVITFLLTIGYILSAGQSQAANEYLNNFSGHCSTGSIEPYFDYSLRDSESHNGTFLTNDNEVTTFFYPNGPNVSDEWRGGIRFRFDLGSTCNKQFKKASREINSLRIELELLKLCGRYKNLELGEQFATVREKCKDIQPKTLEPDDTE
jgi:hypothetical protein